MCPKLLDHIDTPSLASMAVIHSMQNVRIVNCTSKGPISNITGASELRMARAAIAIASHNVIVSVRPQVLLTTIF